MKNFYCVSKIFHPLDKKMINNGQNSQYLINLYLKKPIPIYENFRNCPWPYSGLFPVQLIGIDHSRNGFKLGWNACPAAQARY